MKNVKLSMDFDFDEREALETEARGYLGAAYAECEDGRRFSLCFYSPGRLAQDVEESAMHGRPFIAEQRMIVLTEVTLENMKAAVEQLAGEGFFGT
ncbi:MAG: hypothetical protein JST22_04750 [Bacteroidetes bacterium]|nr:hypothetical protein [Bacteroidota bacterium]